MNIWQKLLIGLLIIIFCLTIIMLYQSTVNITLMTNNLIDNIKNNNYSTSTENNYFMGCPACAAVF